MSYVGAIIINEEKWLVGMELSTFSYLPITMKAEIELDVLQIIAIAGQGLQISPTQIVAQILNVTNLDATITLDKIMRILISHSLISYSITTNKNGNPERLYGLTPLCKYLLHKKNNMSLAQMLFTDENKVFIDTWFYLKDVVLEEFQPVTRVKHIDPIDKTYLKSSGTKTSVTTSGHKARILLAQLVDRYVKKTVRCVKKMEKKVLHSCIRRRYTDPWKPTVDMEFNLPSIVTNNEGISPGFTEDDSTFCSFCNRKMKKRSKHCKSCDKCVDGFDHHCRWLNNCVGRRNYTTFMLLMASTLIMLLLEGGAGLVVFIRNFANKRGIMHELECMYGHRFPRWVFASVVLFLILISAYASAAIGQLFFFHIVLIKKGIRTYDYILAMREECNAEDCLDESDILSIPSSPASSVESFDDNHEKLNFFAKFSCLAKHQENCEETKGFSLKHDLKSELPKIRNPANVNIDPWILIKLTKDEALKAAERARERSSMFKRPSVTETDIVGYARNADTSSRSTAKEGQSECINIKSDLKPSPALLMPMPQERKRGPSINASYVAPPAAGEMESMPLLMQNLSKPKNRFGQGRQHKADSYTSLSLPVFSSTSTIASPTQGRGAYSATSKSLSFTSPLALHHKTNFDLGLTEVSTQLETYISKQVVSSLFRQTREEGSPVQ
ncbi:hypothetical protein KI387_016978 [Taxus chinensis]|uniref:S-acyltransferase n=1 Tax=Taxus chinensis TaxID=29808 RepID=A0AA38LFF1_TAXCH|nr:hypothetical protein KI387_016978 [Taxus chinensis]